MEKSKPYIQKFFKFNNKINPAIITKVVDKIATYYLEDPKISISFSTKEESFSDLDSDDFEYLLEEHFDIADVASFSLNDEEGNSFTLTLQFHNESIGANGNYHLSLDSKISNSKMDEYIWSELNLEKYPTFTQLTNQQMAVNPIFGKTDKKIIPKFCFVLMPFSEGWSDRIWRHLSEIVSSAGFNCKRADNLFGHNILNDIWLAINRAEVIIADITSRNPNVFYEIGIAHTIGKKVILLSQKKEDIPFDFLHYRHILYEDNTDGIKLLENLLPKFLNETTERK
jgi:hypothetical protein